ncbi:ABC transporter ATP-binding protein [Candidatus Nitronereus thalassa]|uniref:ATP-binding cassette domain-containing protein n=1 Tax=Candidatus Nitronereus thalassa TaxID=3020898 RepID=A0ABU3K729_9BACT|nr:ATP-binding cassette domain-containing protein [Candidatus Nitronereus thalassa]MDT7042250.1 ATP-binding cassette domain-containing protein [Candidatus Nitronereus thalassa]
MKSPVLSLHDVCKTFGPHVQALQDLNLNIFHGETVVLIGESGSGKTTLLRMLNGLEHPTSGAVRIHGESIHGRDPIEIRRHIGYVQQDGGLLPHWTVEENIGLVPLLLGWDVDTRAARVEALLELIHLDPSQFRTRYPIQLSGGQRQRVAFARALAADPDIILFDEPFGALDAITRHQLQEEFLELKQRLNKTLTMVTHDIDEAFLLGDRIAVLKDGHLLQFGSPEELLYAPAHEYISHLLQHRSRGRDS